MPAEALDALRRLLDALPADLAREAFTHASWVEHRTESWERLAFLGDSVLGLAVSNELFPRFPDAGAGRLTKLRAQAVNRESCAAVARRLGVPERMARSAPAEPDADPAALAASDRILASVCEAVIGAIYLEFGFERTAPAVVEAFAAEIEAAVNDP